MSKSTYKALNYLLFPLNLLAILFFWWQNSAILLQSSRQADTLLAFGQLTGLLTQYLILVQLLLISRAPIIEKVYGFDKLNELHRKIGYTLGVGILIHPVLVTMAYSGLSGLTIWAQFLAILEMQDVRKAFIGLLIMLSLVIMAIPIFRKRMRYDKWHGLHLFMYLAIGLVFLHQIREGVVSYGSGLYYWFTLNFLVFGSVITYRFIRPVILYKNHRFYVDRVVKESADTYSIYIKGKKMEDFKFEAGQYVNVSFLTKRMWEPHPFSLSSEFNGEYLRLTIKASGDFTSNISSLLPGTKVIVEGPLGRFTESSSLRDKYLFIAGGIGITPIRSLIGSLAKSNRDIILLYGCKTAEDAVFKGELDNMITRKHYILSQTSESGFESGHIDKEKIARLAPDLQDREIYLCGSKPMMKAVLSALKELQVPRSQIHYELFTY